jgi:hypothetical protein
VRQSAQDWKPAALLRAADARGSHCSATRASATAAEAKIAVGRSPAVIALARPDSSLAEAARAPLVSGSPARSCVDETRRSLESAQLLSALRTQLRELDGVHARLRRHLAADDAEPGASDGALLERAKLAPASIASRWDDRDGEPGQRAASAGGRGEAPHAPLESPARMLQIARILRSGQPWDDDDDDE